SAKVAHDLQYRFARDNPLHQADDVPTPTVVETSRRKSGDSRNSQSQTPIQKCCTTHDPGRRRSRPREAIATVSTKNVNLADHPENSGIPERNAPRLGIHMSSGVSRP